MITQYPLLPYVLGYTVAIVLGHFIVGYTVDKLWKMSEEKFERQRIWRPPYSVRPIETIRILHGLIERALYASCIILGEPKGIAVWLAFKALMRLKVSEEPDVRHVPGSPIYLIGTAMNVAFGVIGGFIALGRWSFYP